MHFGDDINISAYANSAISVRDLLYHGKLGIRYLMGKWRLLSIVAVIGGVLGWGYARYSQPKFLGVLTFTMDNVKFDRIGSYADATSEYGVDLGGGGPNGVFGGDNVIEFLRSRLIVEGALLTDTIFNGRRCTLADLYIDAYKGKSGWLAKLDTHRFSFPPGLGQLSYLQDSIMSLMCQRIRQENLEISRPDKNLAFVRIKAISIDERFSKVFPERVLQKAIDFYILAKKRHSQGIIDKLQFEADSLSKLLSNKTYSVAADQDMNQNPARQMALVAGQMDQFKVAMLDTLYTEVLKNLETSKTMLVREMPFIQVVDSPIFPLEIVRFHGVLMGISLSVLLVTSVSFFLLIGKYFRSFSTRKYKVGKDGINSMLC